MKVSYTCDACGCDDVAVEVPVRGAEDVVTWVRNIMTPPLIADHKRRSPACRVASFTHVKIPLAPGSDRVGEETKH